MQTHIYALIDPRKGLVFYIGKTNDPLRRLKDGYKSNAAVRGRLTDIANSGYTPELQVIEIIIPKGETLSKTDWVPREKYWIEFYKNNGFDLLNQNHGGGGPTTHSAKTRKTMSLAAKNRVFSSDRRASLSKGVSEYHKNRKVREADLYRRNCPTCGKALEYKFKCARKYAEQKKVDCKSCAGRKRQTGKFPSKAAVQKRSTTIRNQWATMPLEKRVRRTRSLKFLGGK